MNEKRTHITIESPITEMADAIELSSLVKVDTNLLTEVTDGDTDPRFVISDIEECRSGNNIEYDEEAFAIIAEQVNETQPTGYLGHIKDGDRDSAFPAPQVLWLGSVVSKIGGKAHLITKGYLLPEGTARSLMKRKVITSVSWSGDGILTPQKSGGYKLKGFKLESIDFSRKNREGLKGQRLAIVTEELNDRNKGGKSEVEDNDATYERIVSQLTFSELKAHNPGLIKSISEQVKDEVKTETDAAVQAKAEEVEKAKDAEIAALPEVSQMAKIKELLGLDKVEDAFDAVVQLVEKLDDAAKEAVKSWFNSEILDKKVPNEKARRLIGRLIPVTEMEGDWKTEKGIEKIKSDLEARVDDALENDEDIKSVVREMGSNRGGLRLPASSGGGGNNASDHDTNNNGGNNNSGIPKSANYEVEEVTIG